MTARLCRVGTMHLVLLLAVAACDTADRTLDQEGEQTAQPGADTTRAQPQPDTAQVVDRAAALRAALDQLVRGEWPREADAHSWFSRETADVISSVSVDPSGHAVVDFTGLRERIPNASASAGSAILLDELNAAVFSVAGIESVDYRIEGSCDEFWEWLQYGCRTVQRDR